MSKQSKFLPDSVSSALRSMLHKLCGVVILCVSLWAVFALFFHNPYLDGVLASGNFGNQSFMGNFVGLLRYTIGFVPSLFLLLCIGRWGFSLMFGTGDEGTPEYNILRGFVGLCLGSAGFGMVAPRATFGGMIGAIAASDISSAIGGFGILIGVLCLVGFFIIAGVLLHISFSDVIAIFRRIARFVRWILTAFHLMRPLPEEEYEEDEEDAEEETEEPEEEVKPRRRAVRRKTKSSGDVQYELPYPEFLEQSNFGKNVVTPELKHQASLLETHFAEYGVNGRVTGIRPGPIVTLYEFKPESGTRMVDVNKTVSDMTRAMATERIRIAHIPRTDLVGVEMVNLNRQVVRFRDLVENDAFVNSKYKIPLALGVDIGGNPMYFDLAKMPHMLVAGRTGTGKSVFVQSIITSIVYHFTPDKCKLMIIDPKGVDFGFWDDIPHLITPIVKLDPVPAVNALKWAVREMDDRYKQLQLLNAQNIEQYNDAVAKKRESGEKLTRQVAVGTDPETGELEYETQEVD